VWESWLRHQDRDAKADVPRLRSVEKSVSQSARVHQGSVGTSVHQLEEIP
jgi:hypothetical protein